MLNQVVMVGRLVKNPEIIETENGKRVSNITLAVQKPYKNLEGNYDADFIDVTLWNSIAENTAEYVKKGDLIGVKGRLQTDSFEKKDGHKEVRLNVVADKVTFLSSKSHEELESER